MCINRELQMASEKIGIEIISYSFRKVLGTCLIAKVKRDNGTSSFSANLQGSGKFVSQLN